MIFATYAAHRPGNPRTTRSRADALLHVCTLLDRFQEFRKIPYFAVEAWRGQIVPQEADQLRWVDFPDGSTSTSTSIDSP